jgi:O-antigen/teichoic acid export membrane protein
VYVLAPTLYISFLVGTGDKLLWARGKVRLNAYVALADIALNVALSIALVSRFGVAGAAWAMLISVAVTNGLWLMPYICREAGVPMRRYLRIVLWPALAPVLPTAVIVIVAREVVPATSYLQVALLAALCAASYWLLFLSVSGRQESKRWWILMRGSRVAHSDPQIV